MISPFNWNLIFPWNIITKNWGRILLIISNLCLPFSLSSTLHFHCYYFIENILIISANLSLLNPVVNSQFTMGSISKQHFYADDHCLLIKFLPPPNHLASNIACSLFLDGDNNCTTFWLWLNSLIHTFKKDFNGIRIVDLRNEKTIAIGEKTRQHSMNNAAMNVCVPVFVWTYFYFSWIYV